MSKPRPVGKALARQQALAKKSRGENTLPLRGAKPGTGRKPNRKSKTKHIVSSPPQPRQPRLVLVRKVKFFYGIFLLPVAWLLTETFFGSFSQATLRQEFWLTDEFWFFTLGSVLWLLWFSGSIWSLGEPRPLRLYVFGHELTHAIWVWLSGGRVTEFEVSREGGSILTDTDNVWVALSPYFYPIFSVAVIIVYGCFSIFYDVAGSCDLFLWMTPLQWLFLLLGVSWAFHLSFSCWMIPKGQSDLTSQGTFFSLVFIYLMNVAFLAVVLIVAAPEITWSGFGSELLENAISFSAWIVSGFEQLRRAAESL